jgi:hypothetical protein
VHHRFGPFTIVLLIISIAIAIALVNSVSSFAQPADVVTPAAGNPQQITETPTDADSSVAGSTEAIMWMGLVIASIILLPLLFNRATWRNPG